ncbi:hypothetical protein DTW90_31430 [Neorhizobium sp. P12A]|nr:hypothetical protein DTW90_31430 [Neorhizobium sp. P12A]TCR69277.1 hypothetical protein EV561_1415 [Rhizobium sp. BK376]
MTVHAPISHANRSLLPRSLLGRRVVRNYVATYRFTVGQTVIFASTPAVVLERSRSAKGREVYKIFLFDKGDRPYRHVFGSVLQPVS